MSEPKINYLGPASEAAIATLQHMGYMYNGGQQWKPPIGTKPDFDLIDTVRAERDALQLRLNEADQRIDELESQLAYAVDALNEVVKVSAIYEKPFEIATLAIGELSASAEPA
ncbi:MULTISPECIES: hypothetical protein [unclassified Pseudomonas]|uniref:Uncharacterized protein n=1 Tax=viral metagenome TaxID=1070528 RepID=A0A6M3M143_9ZZZZ|nr:MULTISPECIES: hypothetical protein [unclassified Pseudomonas]MBU0523459.1 SlyX family protein [Gammaproteobacteria bacterium]MBU0819889.1 SlyX family protein [Gammaproteobacteria bacterium]MBU0842012.1 SlyX family protein [Gammaproteobacteria bacterium]MBU1842839.1 SlyX family protein [Gammaproteobacteria bacterium]PMV90077.1 hypothetical protein C1X51_24615 [Pseudomonas sp. FW306-2-2C-B10A]